MLFLCIIINGKNSCPANIFVETMILFYKIFFNENKSSKEQHLFEMEIFCNIINVFTDTSDQINAPLIK